MALVLDGTNGVSGVDGTASNPAIEGTDSNTGIFYPAADTVAIGTGGTEALRVNSSQNVGIGTQSPAKQLDLAASNTGITTGDPLNTLRFTDTDTTSAAGQPMGRIEWYSADTDTAGVKAYIQAQATDGSPDADMVFATNHVSGGGTAERMRIQYDGNVGIGTTSPGQRLDLGGGSMTLSSSTGTQQIYLYRFSATNYSSIGTDSSAGGITFTTGTSSPTERMRLDASGNLGIGTGSPGAKLEVLTASTGNTIQTAASFYYPNNTGGGLSGPRIDFAANNSAGSRVVYSSIWSLIGSNSAHSGDLVFATASSGTVTERARITSGGDFLVATTDAALTSGVGQKIVYSATAPKIAIVGSASTNASTAYSLYSTGAGAYRFYVDYSGTISATTTTITGISDVRLKENIRDLDDGLDAVMLLKPRKFDWKEGKGANTKDARGFIAQEFEQVFPDMIEQWMDEPPEGEEPYKAVNANLIPTLVKAIQELKAELDATKAKVAALENA